MKCIKNTTTMSCARLGAGQEEWHFFSVLLILGLVGKQSSEVRHPIRSQRSHSSFPRDFICPVSLPFHLVTLSLHLSSFPWIMMSLTSSKVSTRRDVIRKLGEPKMFKSLFPSFRSRLWGLIAYNMVVHTCEVNFYRRCHVYNSDWWNWFLQLMEENPGLSLELFI